MQDKYTGDVGDFGKYLLLNELAGLTDGTLRLGINWYYVSGAMENNNDGRHTRYLNPIHRDRDRFRICSPELYQKLKIIVGENRRRIIEIEQAHILPAGTIFYSVPVPIAGHSLTRYSAAREAWFQHSVRTLLNADIVFLDPDNGIHPRRGRRLPERAFKYAFDSELSEYFRSGKSLVVYNHRDRRPKQIYDNKFLNLRDTFGDEAGLRILRFKRVSVRDYVFIAQRYHKIMFDELVCRLTDRPMNFLFERYEL